jgi:molecular chaperone DnaK (HSP70)
MWRPCGITQTLISKTLQPVKKALRDAGLRADEVKGVVMVGAPPACRRYRRR